MLIILPFQDNRLETQDAWLHWKRSFRLNASIRMTTKAIIHAYDNEKGAPVNCQAFTYSVRGAQTNVTRLRSCKLEYQNKVA